MNRQPLPKTEPDRVRNAADDDGTLLCIRFRALFSFGDAAFLLTTGVTSVYAMYLVHKFGLNFALTAIVGMAAAMLVQILLSIIVTPVLGSIETSVPSMVVAMLAPMAVCALELFGHMPTSKECLILGVAFGLSIFVFMRHYDLRCRRLICRASLQKGSA